MFKQQMFSNKKHYLSAISLIRRKSLSSHEWLERQLNDVYVKKARYKNYRCRSAFKLIEIDDKYHLLYPGMIVIECGAAPGSWTQVITERLKLTGDCVHKSGAVIAIDKRAIAAVDGAVMMPRTDFTKSLNQAKILNALNGKRVDLVCSDMAPNASGLQDHDHQVIISLCYSAFQFAINVLKPDTGVFLCKVWNGYYNQSFIQHLSKFFNDVKVITPDACREDSTESYVLARQFIAVKP